MGRAGLCVCVCICAHTHTHTHTQKLERGEREKKKKPSQGLRANKPHRQRERVAGKTRVSGDCSPRPKSVRAFGLSVYVCVSVCLCVCVSTRAHALASLSPSPHTHMRTRPWRSESRASRKAALAITHDRRRSKTTSSTQHTTWVKRAACLQNACTFLQRCHPSHNHKRIIASG